MDVRCQAVKDRDDGSTQQCARRKWGQTNYCYQHAIRLGEAIVVSPWMLATAVGGVLGHDKRAVDTGIALWRDLERQREAAARLRSQDPE